MTSITIGHGTSRTEHVATTIRDRIAARSLLPGAKLPSIRRCAALLGVSNSTVVGAYDRLVAEGTIASRPGSGFYVTGHMVPLSLAEIGPKLDRAVDPFWISRQSLDAGTDMIKPGCGWLPASWMPEQAIRRALRSLSRASDTILADYGTPQGLLPLRHLLARRMAEFGLEAPPEHIMLTDCGTEAIDLLCRFLIEPGDKVLVDDPCYFNFQALLRAHRADIIGVPFTSSGPDPEQFAALVGIHHPRLYITNSGLHNPTGASLSAATTHRILKTAEQHDLIIIEDAIFDDFENTPSPHLAAFDGLNRVIHIGSFSKTLSASVRCGYIVTRPDWIEGLIDLKIATTFGSNRLSAELVLALLKDGSYRKHMVALRDRLARTMSQTAIRLKSIGIHPMIEPGAGLFLWCTLPDQIDAADLARKALAEGIVLAPGNVFSLSQNARHHMRFNVAQCEDPRLFDFLIRTIPE
ncbi:PLP-dependent aminotransferase family protein [Thalassospira sp.]|uniref:aminotransferase-like domain-containing protein n=1 Tax=Thalassospira sp. TaxID=1912094 RepID=UPI0027357A2A|nr:PLP-dependent aminotransferase family protein [Thalassospira sp.]MDP2698256.1 PLP-dependent aminotransferase family protein [Thalassospira sp.]